MGAINITAWGMLAAFLLLLIPLSIDRRYRLGLLSPTLTSVARMSIQLLVVGFFLNYIFILNKPLLNLAWLLLMITAAILSALNNAKLKFKPLLIPIIIGFTSSTLAVLLYFNHFVISLPDLFEARYLIALGGMLLGNVLSINITALNAFYQSLLSQEKYYLYRLSLGATRTEALAPFLRESFQLALRPALAKTATMGIVSLPGMMTGQILGGSSPTTAINYQIAIMLAIYVCGALSALITLLISYQKTFTSYHTLKPGLFK